MVKVEQGYNVTPLLEELEHYPELWDRYDFRTTRFEGSPHAKIHDIWLRYNDYSNFDEEFPQAFSNQHESVWYSSAWMLLNIKKKIEEIFSSVGGKELGGCLITKVPPGERVLPHTDNGWHAEYYDKKYLLCLKSNEKQKFCFEDEEHIGLPGDLFEFNNQALHWVENNSNEDRISLIMAIR